MTSEEKVKRVYPDARIVYSVCAAQIITGGLPGDPLPCVELGIRVGFNRDDRQAWADAWRNIQKRKDGDRND